MQKLHVLWKEEILFGQVRRVMISRMAKPEEVLIVENEQGEVVREFLKDTDSINLYKNMRETLGKTLLKRLLLYKSIQYDYLHRVNLLRLNL